MMKVGVTVWVFAAAYTLMFLKPTPEEQEEEWGYLKFLCVVGVCAVLAFTWKGGSDGSPPPPPVAHTAPPRSVAVNPLAGKYAAAAGDGLHLNLNLALSLTKRLLHPSGGNVLAPNAAPMQMAPQPMPSIPHQAYPTTSFTGKVEDL